MSEADVVDGELVEDVKVEEVKKPPTLKELLNPARAKDESFADYKIRRRAVQTKLKNHAHGNLIFASRVTENKKTYSKTYRREKTA